MEATEKRDGPTSEEMEERLAAAIERPENGESAESLDGVFS